jgi:hypothetical protein
VAGEDSDGDPANFLAFPYRRTGLRGGVGLRVSPLSQVTIEGRLDLVDAELPAAPTRTLPDGTVVPVELGLAPGESQVVTLGIGFDRDTRPDPVLAYGGDRLIVAGELGAGGLGGDYDFATLVARYGRWFSVAEGHVVSVHLTGGLVLGDAPRYERFYVGDVNKLLSPRALGLVVSTLPSHDLLGTTAEEVTYGELLGAFEVEYSYRLFRDRFHFYGGDLFIGAGIFSLSDLGDDQPGSGPAPLDLMFDVGLRLDTAVGIFELTFANALGRVPL